MVTLNHPAQGNTNWFSPVDQNWTTLEQALTFGIGSIPFSNGTTLVSSSSLSWDNTNLILKVNGALQIGGATDATSQGDLVAGKSGSPRMFWQQASGGLFMYGTNGTVNFEMFCGSTGNVFLTPGVSGSGTSLIVQKATVGGSTGSLVSNTDNTNVGSHAYFGAFSGGTSGGDAYIEFTNQTTPWSVGERNSDSQKFQICQNSSLGSSIYLSITTGGLVGINQNNPRRHLDILDSSNPQLRLTYTDNSVYQDLQVQSDGSLVHTAAGTGQNIGFWGSSWGGGSNVLFVGNAGAVPTSNPTGGDSLCFGRRRKIARFVWHGDDVRQCRTALSPLRS